MKSLKHTLAALPLLLLLAGFSSATIADDATSATNEGSATPGCTKAQKNCGQGKPPNKPKPPKKPRPSED
jgi:hypothetical protein